MLKISSVTERVYRGLCNRDPEIFASMRELYISKEENIYSRLNEYKDNFNEKEYNRLTKYIRSFFDIVRSESEFKEKILSKCRG
jgi:hypothetical protein